jgi:hypothetical protein
MGTPRLLIVNITFSVYIALAARKRETPKNVTHDINRQAD